MASAALRASQHGQTAHLAVPLLGSCASSGRAWRLRTAWHSQGEPRPRGTQPLPRVLELAASRAADFTAFDHLGIKKNQKRRTGNGLVRKYV